MITRNKSIIIISGKCSNSIMPIIRNHEGVVETADPSNVNYIWSKNKTPIITLEEFIYNFKTYSGRIERFDLDEAGLNSSSTQEEITATFTKFCYSCKIEPGEFKVKNKANNSAHGCIFCENIINDGDTLSHNKKCPFVDVIIYESENFVVVPGLGPLTEGYLMIMTKQHYLSLAQIPENLYDEYLEVERDMCDLLETMYGRKVSVFEHGTGANGAVGLKSIVHMHMHLMLDNALSKEYLRMYSMVPIESVCGKTTESYFYYKSPNGEMWMVTDPEVYIQRQVHRQIYAEEHGLAKGQFNWRTTAFTEKTETNVWQLYMHLKNETDGRIKERTKNFVLAAKERFDEAE